MRICTGNAGATDCDIGSNFRISTKRVAMSLASLRPNAACACATFTRGAINVARLGNATSFAAMKTSTPVALCMDATSVNSNSNASTRRTATSVRCLLPVLAGRNDRLHFLRNIRDCNDSVVLDDNSAAHPALAVSNN